MTTRINPVLKKTILVSKSLRTEIKERVYTSHLGYDSIMRRLKETFFWPGMAKEIRQLCDACEPCQDLKPRNGPGPLKSKRISKVYIVLWKTIIDGL